MQKFLKKLIYRPMILIFLFVLIFYFPVALLREPDSQRRLIITALGIDKVDDEYEVSALCFIPIATTNYQKNYKVISAKDQTFVNAVKKVGIYAGKISSLPHTSIIVVSEDVQREGLTQCLDHLVRTNNIGNDTVLIGTDVTAKEILECSYELDISSNLSLRNLLSYNFEYIYGNRSNLESFFRGYFSPTRTSMLGFVKMDNNEGVGPDSGSQNSQDSSMSVSLVPVQNAIPSNSSTKNKKILNDGSACVFKDGKLKLILDSEMVEFFNLFETHSNKSILKIENYSDDKLKNATISFQIEQKPVIYQSNFYGGMPEMNYIIRFILTLDEIDQEKYIEADYHLSQSLFTKKMERAIQNKVKEDFSKLIEVLRDNQLDVLKVYKTFEVQNKNEFLKYINSLEDKDDYLRYINFNVITNVSIKA